MKTKILATISLMLLLGCGSISTSSDGIMNIKVDDCQKIDENRVVHDDFIKSTDYIALETTDESLISEIKQIEFHNQLIYIYDDNQSQLLVFNSKGEFVRQIGKRGNGPEEYIAINAFYINPDDKTINLFDPMNMAVIKYSLEGQFINRVKHENQLLDFIYRATYIGKGKVVCSTILNWSTPNALYILSDKDYKIAQNITDHPVNVSIQMGSIISNYPYSVQGDEIHFVSPFSNEITSFSGSKTSPLYYLNNNKETIPKSTLQEIFESNDQNYFRTKSKIYDDDKYTLGYKDIFETDRFLCLTGVYFDASLWDKKNGNGFRFNSFTSNSPSFGNIGYCKGNSMVRIWPSNEISEFKKNLANNPANRDLYSAEVLSLVDNFNPENNPVIISYNLK